MAESSKQEITRIARQIPVLRRLVESLRNDLGRLQQWVDANPTAPHPAAPGGVMEWDVLVGRFGAIERELKVLKKSSFTSVCLFAFCLKLPQPNVPFR